MNRLPRYYELERIFDDHVNRHGLDEAARIRFRLVGLRRAVVGPEWGSHGRFDPARGPHSIQFVYGGLARLIHEEGQTTVLRPGHAYWIPPTPLVRVCRHRYKVFYLTFRCELIEGVDMFAEWPERRPIHLGCWDMAGLRREWRQIPISLNAGLRLQGMLAQWAATYFPGLDRIIAQHREIHARFERVLDLIDARLSASLRIGDLAKAHGTSVSTFSHAFERSLGLSPKAYLNRRLNREACRLVVNTDERIKTIAGQLRFADEYYFCRFFTKMNGIPPATYRRQQFHNIPASP
ncbi:MAG: AraC family transcriptional regulator [Kiritimatiellae bacterium]|nr:AraC family transcriptional regulator [Kiritimatiellia bacterium]